MIDFSGPTDAMYDVFGQAATYYASPSDSGTSCTVCFSRKGEERADRGVVETAVIQVRKSEVPAPQRGDRFELGGRTWRVEFLLGSDEGTNEEETALSCTSTTHLGMS